MKLRLVESAQPISKLENNIERNILPEFKKYGYSFNSTPLEINKFISTYDGVGNDFVSLRLNTTSPEIDVWNDTNSDEYVGDLFAELTVNGKKIDLGVLSSRDPNSVDSAMVDFNKDEYRLPTDDERKRAKLIPPKNNDGRYSAMTKKEWQDEYRRLLDDTDKIRNEINAMKQKVLDEEFKTNEKYRKLQDDYEKMSSDSNNDTYWQEHRLGELENEVIERELGSNEELKALEKLLKDKADYLDTFYRKIYPFNDIE